MDRLYTFAELSALPAGTRLRDGQGMQWTHKGDYLTPSALGFDNPLPIDERREPRRNAQVPFGPFTVDDEARYWVIVTLGATGTAPVLRPTVSDWVTVPVGAHVDELYQVSLGMARRALGLSRSPGGGETVILFQFYPEGRLPQ